MSLVPHAADAEEEFFVKAVTPDFCRVGKAIVPFFPARILKPEKADYAVSVFARGEQVLMVKSIVGGTKGNAGRGVKSGVSQTQGHVEVVEGENTIFVEGRKLARHDDLCKMNCRVDG